MRIINTVFIAIAAFVSIAVNAAVVMPPPPAVDAKGFVLMDYTTSHVISEQNADMRLAPASLTKMMTVYVIGMELNNGTITTEDRVTISERAWAKNFPGSSLMFLEAGKQVPVAELVQGIMVSSGNDACVAMAEHIAGSEDAFASMMNAYAAKLGMTSSNFVNSHGLDHPEHYTSPRDMAILAQALVRDVPELYEVYSQKEYTFNNIKQYNRNPLLWDKSLNVDGIKTGHTSEAGYSLVTSATQGDMRLVSVVMGTDSERARKIENKKLLKYGFRFWETLTPYEAGESFVSHRIFMGDKQTVDLGILSSTPITIPRGQAKNLKANFELNEKLEAPMKKGTVVGKLYLQLDGEDIATYPLVTLQEIKQGSIMQRLKDYLKLQLGWES